MKVEAVVCIYMYIYICVCEDLCFESGTNILHKTFPRQIMVISKQKSMDLEMSPALQVSQQCWVDICTCSPDRGPPLSGRGQSSIVLS